MTMWAETTEGMHNLFRASSIASLEGQLYKPRMDRGAGDLLEGGPDRYHRLPLRRDPDAPAPGPVRSRQFRRRATSAISSAGQLLLRSWTTASTLNATCREDLHRLAKSS